MLYRHSCNTGTVPCINRHSEGDWAANSSQIYTTMQQQEISLPSVIDGHEIPLSRKISPYIRYVTYNKNAFNEN